MGSSTLRRKSDSTDGFVAETGGHCAQLGWWQEATAQGRRGDNPRQEVSFFAGIELLKILRGPLQQYFLMHTIGFNPTLPRVVLARQDDAVLNLAGGKKRRRMPDRMPDGMPERMAERMPEDMREKMRQIECQMQYQIECQEQRKCQENAR